MPMVFSMIKTLLFFKITTNPLILHFQTGISMHSVFDSCECETSFRVAKGDIPILLKASRIPAIFAFLLLKFNCLKTV